MSQLSGNFVLGFHGNKAEKIDAILDGSEWFDFSQTDELWLGHGIYFWEGDPNRGMKWAKIRHSKSPSVIGAIIDLGNCLDLTKIEGGREVKEIYSTMRKLQKAGSSPPFPKQPNLDCHILEGLHAYRKGFKAGGVTIDPNPEYDSVRGLFNQGKPLYPDARINVDAHIQICVRNPDSIIGVFRVQDRFIKSV